MNSKPSRIGLIRTPLPLLCRLWHSWRLDHHAWEWDFYECRRCSSRKALGPPCDAANISDRDMKWLVEGIEPPKELVNG
jgi:hypothetical protein